MKKLFFDKSRGAIIKIFKSDQSKAEGALKIFMMEYNHGILQRTQKITYTLID